MWNPGVLHEASEFNVKRGVVVNFLIAVAGDHEGRRPRTGGGTLGSFPHLRSPLRPVGFTGQLTGLQRCAPWDRLMVQRKC
jgi:hypothetical protein